MTDTLALKRVAEAAEAFVAKLHKCEPHIEQGTKIAAIHGWAYLGPTYAAELAALEDALAKVSE